MINPSIPVLPMPTNQKLKLNKQNNPINTNLGAYHAKRLYPKRRQKFMTKDYYEKMKEYYDDVVDYSIQDQNLMWMNLISCLWIYSQTG
ncbi:Uncharacterised protein [Moraxella lacunata]|uniref:Uncharacterized protein n=1 Tax=Moraxella lacunata TaxID=477 RepID=A0A378TUI4_MORLA|nr:hypothetical protein [Moraxella lacunata]STZ63363.1 Uncharacterised protein [Moraxella lacunata]